MKNDLTIGQLSRLYNLSRSTLLYYDRLGLLRPVNRSSANYRFYSPADAARLKEICLYRRLGIPLSEIARLLAHKKTEGQTATILRRRLELLETEITTRQEQQAQIIRLLEQVRVRAVRTRASNGSSAKIRGRDVKSKSSKHKESTVVNKERWVEIMRAAGFSEQAMRQWHHHFEQMEPEAHQEFLLSLGLAANDVAKIRKSAASGR